MVPTQLCQATSLNFYQTFANTQMKSKLSLVHKPQAAIFCMQRICAGKLSCNPFLVWLSHPGAALFLRVAIFDCRKCCTGQYPNAEEQTKFTLWKNRLKYKKLPTCAHTQDLLVLVLSDRHCTGTAFATKDVELCGTVRYFSTDRSVWRIGWVHHT